MSTKDVLAAVESWRIGKAELLDSLRKERDSLVVRIAEVDRALAELGESSSAAPSRGRARHTAGDVSSLTGQILAFVAANPGCRAVDIRESTGLRFPEMLSRLTQQGRIRRESGAGDFRYFPVLSEGEPR